MSFKLIFSNSFFVGFLNFFIFRNYYKTLTQVRNKQFPVTFTFRNGQSVKTTDSREASLLLSRCKGVTFQEDKISIINQEYNDDVRKENSIVHF